MSTNILWRDNRTRRSLSFPPAACLSVQLLSERASSRRLTHKHRHSPPRAMHAKKGPYPPGGSAGVYLQLGGYKNRHDAKCHLPFHPSLFSHLCSLELGLLGVSKKYNLLTPPSSPPSFLPYLPAKKEDDPAAPGARPKHLPLSLQCKSITRTRASPPWDREMGEPRPCAGCSKCNLLLLSFLLLLFNNSLPGFAYSLYHTQIQNSPNETPHSKSSSKWANTHKKLPNRHLPSRCVCVCVF